MASNDVYCTMMNEEDIEYKVRDRVSDKRIEKRVKQIQARKNTKKGTRDESKRADKGDVSRTIRQGRPREVSLLWESSDE